MAIQILRDLRGLRVHVVHPPDTERTKLVEHLRPEAVGEAIVPLDSSLQSLTCHAEQRVSPFAELF